MPTALTVESLDKVEETFRSAYTEAEGKWTLDPDRYAAIKAQGLERKNRELLGKLKSSLTDSEKVVELEKELRHYKLAAPVRELIGKAGIMSDRLDVAFETALKHFKLDDSGQLTVLDRHGDPIDVSPEKFFQTIYKDLHPYFYEASRATGSGGQNINRVGGGSKSMSREAFERLSQTDRMAVAMQPGFELHD